MSNNSYRVAASALNLRSAPDRHAQNIIRQLGVGTLVQRVDSVEENGFWQVKLVSGTEGYASKRHLIALDFQPRPLSAVALKALWAKSSQSAGRIKYKLGQKNSATGSIDCSGWIAELVGTGFDAINVEEKKLVYSDADKRLLHTYADEIIANVSAATGILDQPTNLALFAFRAGMLIGFDSGEHAFERGRKSSFGIDHVVAVLANPEKPADLHISQSCSSGGGVTATLLADWAAKQSTSGYAHSKRVWVVDPFLLGDFT